MKVPRVSTPGVVGGIVASVAGEDDGIRNDEVSEVGTSNQSLTL